MYGTARGRDVLTLVRRARRRLFRNELLREGTNALSAALVALIVLLLLGTQVLSWHWAVVIPLAAAGVGLYRAYRRRPGLYAVAQIVDRRMALEDTLSTALYFSREQAGSHVSPEVRRCQFERAERAAGGIDASQAIPYSVPRGVYAMAALVLVASSLFALRYGLSRRLDLKPPLATIVMQTLGGGERTETAKNQRRAAPPEQQQDEYGSAPADEEQRAGGEADASEDNAADPSSQPDADKSGSQASRKDARQPGDSGDQMNADDHDTQDEDRAEGKQGDGINSGQKGNKGADQKQQASAKQEAGNSNENSSLMSKVKDAVQNLLSRMKPQSGANGQQQQSAREQGGKQGKGQQNGGKQQAKNGQQSGQQGDSEDGQQGEEAKDSQDSQGKGTGKSESQQASKQPGSGVGSQDGDKSIRQAEQLAAMGKISEILGRRSANITGEATVEVQSTSQQLRTPYAQRTAQHTEGGAEINRDEIPVALQGYVEQYFEQVRKQAPGVAAKK